MPRKRETRKKALYRRFEQSNKRYSDYEPLFVAKLDGPGHIIPKMFGFFSDFGLISTNEQKRRVLWA